MRAAAPLGFGAFEHSQHRVRTRCVERLGDFPQVFVEEEHPGVAPDRVGSPKKSQQERPFDHVEHRSTHVDHHAHPERRPCPLASRQIDDRAARPDARSERTPDVGTPLAGGPAPTRELRERARQLVEGIVEPFLVGHGERRDLLGSARRTVPGGRDVLARRFRSGADDGT